MAAEYWDAGYAEAVSDARREVAAVEAAIAVAAGVKKSSLPRRLRNATKSPGAAGHSPGGGLQDREAMLEVYLKPSNRHASLSRAASKPALRGRGTSVAAA